MPTKSDVSGFMSAPIGYLCEQQWDLEADLAYAHERARIYCKSWHTHDRTMLVCPVGAVRVRLRGERRPLSVDSSGVLWLRAHREHQTEAEDDLYDVLALYPSDALIDTMSKHFGVGHPCTRQDGVLGERGPLLTALLQRFLEAALEGQSIRSNLEFRALSQLILCTALRCPHNAVAAAARPQPTLQRVMAAIDADIDRP